MRRDRVLRGTEDRRNSVSGTYTSTSRLGLGYKNAQQKLSEPFLVDVTDSATIVDMFAGRISRNQKRKRHRTVSRCVAYPITNIIARNGYILDHIGFRTIPHQKFIWRVVQRIWYKRFIGKCRIY